MTAAPSRGEIWLINLDPVRGHEQAGGRAAFEKLCDVRRREERLARAAVEAARIADPAKYVIRLW
jgi:hypothetical protein